MSKSKTTTAQETVIIKKKATVKNDGFCVYIGPTITGVIQSGTIYRGNKQEVLASLALAIKKIPLIKTLVVSSETLPEDRIKVKTPGNLLYVNYHKMISGDN